MRRVETETQKQQTRKENMLNTISDYSNCYSNNYMAIKKHYNIKSNTEIHSHQGVDIIIMLTNLEEYNRIKCAQYWPQAGDSNYCTSPVILNVSFCTETRYALT